MEEKTKQKRGRVGVRDTIRMTRNVGRINKNGIQTLGPVVG